MHCWAHCWARYLFIVVVIALGTLSMIGACGHAGPLYLPPPEPPTGTPPAKDAKPGTEVPKVPTAPQPAADPGLLSWPSGSPRGCTGCAGGAEAP